MEENNKQRCHRIIHTHAVTAAVGNAVSVPGMGFAADTVTMTAMAMSLAAVFGADIPESVAKGMAVTAIKRQVLKQPLKMLAKELSKLVPGLGQVVAPTISFAMLEAAGWAMANEMERKAA